jgi:type II secretory pathway predicted ATPase ExeA
MPALHNLARFLERKKIETLTLARAIQREHHALQTFLATGHAPDRFRLITDIESVLIASGYTVPRNLWLDAQGTSIAESRYTLRTLDDYRVIPAAAYSRLGRYRRAVERETLITKQERNHIEVQPLTPTTLKHFKLNFDPFRSEVRQSEDIYWTQEHRAVVDLMLETARKQDFVAIIADVGAGKTLCFRVFLEEKPENIRVITPIAPDKKRISAGGILDAIIYDLAGLRTKIPPRVERKARLVRELLEALEADGKYALLVLDEAHSYPSETIRSLKRLHELERGFAKLIGFLLIGQSELTGVLDNATIREVDRRCARFVMHGLNGNTAAYLAHKLARAGMKSDKLFTPAAIKAIENVSSDPIPHSRKRMGPYPLFLNVVCSAILNYCARNGLDQVTPEVVDRAWGSSPRSEVR